MNKITRNVQVLIAVLLFCVQYISVAQILEPPVLQSGNSACDNGPVPGDFFIDIKFNTAAFNNDNHFIVELSDASGVFGDPAVLLTTLTDPTLNTKFNIDDVGFKLPPGTFGKNYKIRVRTTSPVRESVSDSFEAYENMFNEFELFLTDSSGKDKFTLCAGETRELFLNTTVVGEYLWYKENGAVDILLATTTEPKFTITESGDYFVIIDYGACPNVESIHAIISGISNADSQIKGNTVVEICGDDAHTFEASVSNASYIYEWYLDGELKQSSNSNEYTTPDAGQFGKYVLKIKTGTGADDCVTTSNEVELKQKTTASFTITTLNPGKSILLPCETRELGISDVPSGGTVQWYKDDEAILGQNQPTIFAVEPGVYFARVTKASSGSCPDIVDSEKTTLLAAISFETVIGTGTSYTECASSSAKLSIVGIKAIGSDNEKYDLTNAQISADTPVLIEFQWYKDDVAISGEVTDEHDVSSYLENGKYDLEISSCGVGAVKGNTKDNTPSASLEIKLIGALPVVTSLPNSNSLCPNTGGITYTIDALIAGYTYEWFKDGDTTPLATDVKDFVVDEIGSYVLKMSGLGCEKILDPINVVLFDASIVVVTPSEKVVMDEGETVTVTASGADSYIWYQGEGTSGTILSTNETLDVDALGFYTVVATVGSCAVEKIIEVVEQDDLVIVPNVVTPNGDGKNDSWRISNRYAFQPLITVQLYNSNGKEILNTTDYKNDWPLENVGSQRVFYYKIIRDEKIIKAGTISVLH
ncbi:gliding motility-associated C-terminal domain-containing protein [Tenacibaculum ovolyticum]|uniref:T9SS type B sorting domain-containing protein n=1 Tax=Tenacibaculum ovolyticum TaxID=104270 RepID=UPI0007EDCC3F|nr:gliding motility-associated C-terminal domain-containing protein [Tenacibaculum ovolyticum]WBX77937.1 gliding motility-associated C-terminal domain-containing protein [Tenacibaculum ovolyticum]